jgi:putative transposase
LANLGHHISDQTIGNILKRHGIARRPTEAWIIQMVRNPVDEASGSLSDVVLNCRDAKFCAAFDNVLASEGIRALRLPPRSPNLNAFTERWVRSVNEETSPN